MSTPPANVLADRYRLVEPLGQGGMGRVWKARDEVLHRDVAIKELVPPPGLTEDERREMRERSLREARAIAQLSNANVVRVFDVLRTDGDPWIVMEYVPSRSLQDVLSSDGPVPPVRAAQIGLGVLAALRAAHRAGLVHRDVKPGNVLLGEDGRVVLTDFGLATVPGDPTVTRSGLLLGSPAYIAPERARDGQTGPASDLWSLGATLFAAVEGHSPYARTSAMATLSALASEPPPVAKNAGPLRPVLTGLLRKNPDERITADEADRLLRRAAGRRGRGIALLDGVRRQAPPGREPRTDVVPAPRGTPHPSGDVAALGAAAAAGAAAASHAPAPAPEHPTDDARTTDGVPAGVAPVPVRPVEPTRRAGGKEFAPAGRGEPGNRRKWLIIATVVLLALGFVLAVALLERSPGTDPEAQPGGAGQTQAADPGGSASPEGTPPQATPSAAGPTGGTSAQPPAQSPSSAQTGQPGGTTGPGQGAPALPVGWRLHTDQTGFSVPVPQGWTESRRTYDWGPQVYFNGPGVRRIKIDQTSTQVRPDALDDLLEDEPNKRRTVVDYQRVGEIRRVQGYFVDAADWDWLETINGQRVHVRNRNFITAAGKQAYAIELRLPVDEWNRNGEAQFKAITAGFKPRS